MALKDIDVAASVVDPDRRGEIVIISSNSGTTRFTIQQGMRVAQLILERIINDAEVAQVEQLHFCAGLWRLRPHWPGPAHMEASAPEPTGSDAGGCSGSTGGQAVMPHAASPSAPPRKGFAGSAYQGGPADLPQQLKAAGTHPTAWAVERSDGSTQALQEQGYHCVLSTGFEVAATEQLNGSLADHRFRLIRTMCEFDNTAVLDTLYSRGPGVRAKDINAAIFGVSGRHWRQRAVVTESATGWVLRASVRRAWHDH